MKLTTPVQEKRHEAREAASKAWSALRGTPGISKDDQVARLQEAADAFKAGLDAVGQAYEIAFNRDFDTYLTEKKAAQQKATELFEVVGAGTVSVSEEDEADEPEE
jgi:hypothetical protein